MKIMHIYPECDPLMKKWDMYSKHDLSEDRDGCELVYCASVTQLDRALSVANGLHVVCFVWDLPVNWRSWCRDDKEYYQNIWRDNDISFKLHQLRDCYVISASNSTAHTLRMFGINSKTLYHFYDHELLDRDEAGEKKNRIIQISRYALNKRFDLTLRAWEKIQDKHKDWSMLFVGFGDATHLKELSEELNVRCDIMENVPECQRVELMKESKILVSPSVHEGFNLSPIEAKHCGLAVISSDIPTSNEFGIHDRMFDVDDVDDYADCISDAIERKATSAVGLDVYHADKWAKRFDDYIEEIT